MLVTAVGEKNVQQSGEKNVHQSGRKGECFVNLPLLIVILFICMVGVIRSCLGERKLSSSSENIGADSKLGELDKNKDQLSSTIYQESGQLGVNDDSTSALAQPSLTVGLSSTTTDPKRVPTHGDDLEVTFQASQEVDGAKRSNPGKLDTM